MAPSSPQPSDEFARLRSVEPTSHDRETDEFHQEKVRREAAIAEEHEQRNKNRYGYANIFIRIAIGWLAFVGIIVLANSVDGCPFSISDEAQLQQCDSKVQSSTMGYAGAAGCFHYI
jgi:hypothetical protein